MKHNKHAKISGQVLGAAALLLFYVLRARRLPWRGAAGLLGWSLWQRKCRNSAEPERNPDRERMGIDPVLQASKESFPASDPPAWTLG